MAQRPKLMNFERMTDIFEPHLSRTREHFFINREMAMVYGNPKAFRLVLQQKPPFVIDDYRMGIVVRGEACVNINLVEKRLVAGTLVFIGPGTIISPISFSDDLEIYGVGLSAAFPMPFLPREGADDEGSAAQGALPQAFDGRVRDFQISATEHDVLTARHIVDTLWHVVHQEDYNRHTVSMLAGALMQHYDGLFRRQNQQQQVEQSRELSILDRFIQLVNRHCTQQHHIGYYAERMCLTERYLGTVVRHASGRAAKDWIDRALTTHAKVLLRHTDKSVTQIAEELAFTNASFFCRYFKRMTALTPAEFRRGGRTEG